MYWPRSYSSNYTIHMLCGILIVASKGRHGIQSRHVLFLIYRKFSIDEQSSVVFVCGKIIYKGGELMFFPVRMTGYTHERGLRLFELGIDWSWSYTHTVWVIHNITRVRHTRINNLFYSYPIFRILFMYIVYTDFSFII